MIRPGVALSSVRDQAVTIFWGDDPAAYLGYRFLEGSPRTQSDAFLDHSGQPASGAQERPAFDSPPLSPEAADPWGKSWLAAYQEADPSAPTQLAFQAYADGSAWLRLRSSAVAGPWEMYFRPEENGVRLWLRLAAHAAIEGAYCLQQCLRFTGGVNAAWRRDIAQMPYLSELDMQAMGNPNGTLTFVRQEGRWARFPVGHTTYVTPAGKRFREKAGGPACDQGLVVRETVERGLAPDWYWERVAPAARWERVAAGIYWERTAWVCNRHPADCVHAWVDVGPLEAGETRNLHGKIYFLEGDKNDLLEAWRADFPSPD